MEITVGYKQKNAALNRLKGDVMQDILKRTPLGDTLYDIAMDHKVSEAMVRKWVVPMLEQYKHLRRVWIGKLIAEQTGKKIPAEAG
jgi:hypothetical protein